jgi:hypothetical protein
MEGGIGPAMVVMMAGSAVVTGLLWGLIFWLATKFHIQLGLWGGVLLLGACICMVGGVYRAFTSPADLRSLLQNLGFSLVIFAVVFGIWVRPSSQHLGQFLVLAVLIAVSATLISSALEFWIQMYWPNDARLMMDASSANESVEALIKSSQSRVAYAVFAATALAQFFVLCFFQRPISNLASVSVLGLALLSLAWATLMFVVKKVLN